MILSVPFSFLKFHFQKIDYNIGRQSQNTREDVYETLCPNICLPIRDKISL